MIFCFFLTLTHLKLFYWTNNYIIFDTSFSDILLHWWCHYEYLSYLFLYLSFNNRILWVCMKNLCSQKVIIISCFDFYEFRISSFTKWLENIMDCTCKNNILLRVKEKNCWMWWKSPPYVWHIILRVYFRFHKASFV